MKIQEYKYIASLIPLLKDLQAWEWGYITCSTVQPQRLQHDKLVQ